MKKLFSLALLLGFLVATSAQLHAVAATATPTPIPSFINDGDPTGGNYLLKDRKVFGTGQYPGSTGGWTVPMRTVVDLGMGAPVVFVAVTWTVGVSQTATVGDQTPGGLVILPKGVTSVPAGTVVHVLRGGMAIGKIAVDVTAGDVLIRSATAGYLTKAAAATVAAFVQTSSTARVGIAAQTVTVTAGVGYVKVLVGW